MNDEPPPATHFAAALGTMEASKPRCPICGDSSPYAVSFNGTCSPDCVRTKAVVDAIKHFAEVAVWISTPFMTNYLPKIP